MTRRVSFNRLLSGKSTQIDLITECAVSRSFLSIGYGREASVIGQNVSGTVF